MTVRKEIKAANINYDHLFLGLGTLLLNFYFMFTLSLCVQHAEQSLYKSIYTNNFIIKLLIYIIILKINFTCYYYYLRLVCVR